MSRLYIILGVFEVRKFLLVVQLNKKIYLSGPSHRMRDEQAR
jgi:hypothetical protein